MAGKKKSMAGRGGKGKPGLHMKTDLTGGANKKFGKKGF